MVNKKNITVVGLGYVGTSMSLLLAQQNNVIAFDIDLNKVDKLNKKISPIDDRDISDFLNNNSLNLKATADENYAFSSAEIIIVCAPTDFDDKSNSFNTSLVDSIIENIINFNQNAFIVIKSTLPVGHTEKLQKKFNDATIIFSPEFLREGKALHDNLKPSRIVIGGNCDKCKYFTKLLVNAANKKKNIEILFVSPSEAEAIKLFSNTFLATRVAFFNELDSFARVKGLNTQNIIDGVCLDSRIGNYYNNPSFGYGGYCLPKDTKQLLSNFENIPQAIIEASIKSNEIRKDFISNAIASKKPDTVGVYRLVMKKNSENFRSTAVEDILRRLSVKDINIIIYEPLIKDKQYKQFKIQNNLKNFKNESDLVIANRISDELEDIKTKVYSSDIYLNN